MVQLHGRSQREQRRDDADTTADPRHPCGAGEIGERSHPRRREQQRAGDGQCPFHGNQARHHDAPNTGDYHEQAEDQHQRHRGAGSIQPGG